MELNKAAKVAHSDMFDHTIADLEEAVITLEIFGKGDIKQIAELKMVLRRVCLFLEVNDIEYALQEIYSTKNRRISRGRLS